MATTTEHYGFAKPDGDDNVDITVLNGNMDAIDNLIYEANQAIENELYVDEDAEIPSANAEPEQEPAE